MGEVTVLSLGLGNSGAGVPRPMTGDLSTTAEGAEKSKSDSSIPTSWVLLARSTSTSSSGANAANALFIFGSTKQIDL